jgi:signal transduction histidine kinase
MPRDGAGAGSEPAAPPARALLWVQLLIGWLPVWALFAIMIATAHPQTRLENAAMAALRMALTAAALGLLVHRLVRRLPWPHPFRVSFLARHLLAACAFAGTWVCVNVVADYLHGRPALQIAEHLRGPLPPEIGGGYRVTLVAEYPLGPYLILGVWLYVMVAGVGYAALATERAARAETLAARAQLEALRAQLHPHFLFNALHAVVHLIPREPRRAAAAAEQLGELLRAAIDQERDLVPLPAEIAFVERYLELERLRFGDRLTVEVAVDAAAAAALVPSFALLTLVENAVRHGAAPRVEPTRIAVSARRDGGELRLAVHDSGGGATPEQLDGRQGSGLRRLRERLAALYGTGARLDLDSGGEGFVATLTLPWRDGLDPAGFAAGDEIEPAARGSQR